MWIHIKIIQICQVQFGTDPNPWLESGIVLPLFSKGIVLPLFSIGYELQNVKETFKRFTIGGSLNSMF